MGLLFRFDGQVSGHVVTLHAAHTRACYNSANFRRARTVQEALAKGTPRDSKFN